MLLRKGAFTMSMEGVHLHISIPEAIAPSEDQSYGVRPAEAMGGV